MQSPHARGPILETGWSHVRLIPGECQYLVRVSYVFHPDNQLCHDVKLQREATRRSTNTASAQANSILHEHTYV